MKFDLNRALAYITSSMMLSLFVVCSIDFDYLKNGWFWAFVVPLSIPCGLVLETFYSWAYVPMKNHNLGSWFFFKKFKDKNYKNNSDFNSFRAYNESSFQVFLTENNIVRNMWMSCLLSGFMMIFIGIFYAENTILKSRIEIWLPILLLLSWISNQRSEYYVKVTKMYAYEKEKKKERE